MKAHHALFLLVLLSTGCATAPEPIQSRRPSYRLVASTDPAELIVLVEVFMRAGYRPVGAPQQWYALETSEGGVPAASTRGVTPLFVQAVEKP